jgi:hypothetical protein
MIHAGVAHFRPLLALSGHPAHSLECPLSGVKRTWRAQCEMSAYDPKRTSGNPSCPVSHLGRGQIAARAINM